MQDKPIALFYIHTYNQFCTLFVCAVLFIINDIDLFCLVGAIFLFCFPVHVWLA